MRLLLIEDEEVIGRVTSKALQEMGFTVDWVRSGSDARAAVLSAEYDALLVDLGLPDVPGGRLISDLRSAKVTTPVVVLTARGQVADRVTLLDLGADDFLAKPFDVLELAARLRALRRRVSAQNDVNDVQKVGPLELRSGSRSVRWDGRPIPLTAKEFDLLEALVLRRPRVVSRAQLDEALYGWDDEVDSNAIDVYVHFLRRKFGAGLILTVRGKGYRLAPEDVLYLEARRSAKESN
jgi:DNA-binding response OmpR family regulator